MNYPAATKRLISTTLRKINIWHQHPTSLVQSWRPHTGREGSSSFHLVQGIHMWNTFLTRGKQVRLITSWGSTCVGRCSFSCWLVYEGLSRCQSFLPVCGVTTLVRHVHANCVSAGNLPCRSLCRVSWETLRIYLLSRNSLLLISLLVG
jgi:hypothetical protein